MGEIIVIDSIVIRALYEEIVRKSFVFDFVKTEDGRKLYGGRDYSLERNEKREVSF